MSTLLVKLISFLLRSCAIDKLHYPAAALNTLLRFYRPAIIEENLKMSFPQCDKGEINTLSKAYHHHLSRVIVESFKGFSLPQSVLAERFVFKNPAIANQYYDQGRSIILVLGHVGNWEWGQAVVSHYLDHNCVGVYKPLSDSSFNNYVLSKRSQYRVKLLPQKQLLKYLISHQEETNVYIFIADQYPPTDPRLAINFLGRSTYFDTSVEKIARKYDLPVIYADIRKVDDGTYETELIEISSDSSKTENGVITKKYAELLETNILRAPQLWLWSHRRWKQ